MNRTGPTPKRPLPSLRQLLLLLAFASVVPMAGLALALVAYEYRQEVRQTEASTVGTARALVAAVDDRLQGTQRALLSLAESPALAVGDIGKLQEEARVLQRAERVTNVVLLDLRGHQWLNTGAAGEAPLPVEARPQMLEAIRRKEPAVLDLYRSPVSGQYVAGVGVPTQDPTGVLRALNADIAPATLREVLARQKLPSTWIAAILDSTGAIVARTHDHDRYLGTSARPALMARIAEVPEDAVESTTVDGVPVVTAFSRSAHSGWSVAIGIPRSELRAAIRESALRLLAGTAIVLLLTLALAWRMASSLGASVEALGGAVRATGHKARLALPRPAFQEAHQLGQSFAHAHAALEDAHDALAHGEARMRAILHAASEAIVTADDDGRIVLFNPAAERMFRIREEDALGREIESLVPAHLRGRHGELRRRASEGAARRMAAGRTVEGLRGDGTTFRAEASISVAEDGTGRLYTAMLREVPADDRAPA